MKTIRRRYPSRKVESESLPGFTGFSFYCTRMISTHLTFDGERAGSGGKVDAQVDAELDAGVGFVVHGDADLLLLLRRRRRRRRRRCCCNQFPFFVCSSATINNTSASARLFDCSSSCSIAWEPISKVTFKTLTGQLTVSSSVATFPNNIRVERIKKRSKIKFRSRNYVSVRATFKTLTGQLTVSNSVATFRNNIRVERIKKRSKISKISIEKITLKLVKKKKTTNDLRHNFAVAKPEKPNNAALPNRRRRRREEPLRKTTRWSGVGVRGGGGGWRRRRRPTPATWRRRHTPVATVGGYSDATRP